MSTESSFWKEFEAGEERRQVGEDTNFVGEAPTNDDPSTGLWGEPEGPTENLIPGNDATSAGDASDNFLRTIVPKDEATELAKLAAEKPVPTSAEPVATGDRTEWREARRKAAEPPDPVEVDQDEARWRFIG